MNDIRKILLISTFFVFFVGANAQYKHAIAIKGGLNAPIDNNGGAGFHIGIMTQFGLYRNLGLELGTYYTSIGFSEAYINYIQLPLLAIYKFKLSPDVYIWPSTGVYGAVCFDIGDFFNTEKYQASSDYDYGFSFGVGLGIERIVINAGYDMGMETIIGSKYSFFDSQSHSGKNKVVKLSIGYLF